MSQGKQTDTAPDKTPEAGVPGKKVKGIFIKSATLPRKLYAKGETAELPEKTAKRLEKKGFFKIK